MITDLGMDRLAVNKSSTCLYQSVFFGHGEVIDHHRHVFIRVYILDLATKGVSMFGHSGSGPGCFKDPAGLAVDRLYCKNLRRKCIR